MVASSLAPNSARSRAPRLPAARPAVGRRQPLVLWAPVVTAVVGSVLLVAVFFMILPPRHSAAAAPEDVQTAQIIGDQARPEVADLVLCPPPPAAPAILVPDAPALSDLAAPVAIQTAPTTQEQTPPELLKVAEVDPNAFVNFAAVAQTKTPGCQQYGTAVDFYDSSAIANKNALKDDKLVFVLHVAGNFEEPGFT